jgi:hypothetical protein
MRHSKLDLSAPVVNRPLGRHAAPDLDAELLNAELLDTESLDRELAVVDELTGPDRFGEPVLRRSEWAGRPVVGSRACKPG